MQVLDLKDRSPAWVKALFVKRIYTLRASATLLPCAWHQRLPPSRGGSPARLIKFNRAFLMRLFIQPIQGYENQIRIPP
jgi:hypothetical protein